MSETSPDPAPTLPGWLDRLINPVVYKDLLTVSVSPAQSSPMARLVLYSMFLAIPLLGLAWAVSFHPGPWRFAGRPVLLGFCALLCFFHVSVAVPAATAFALERDRNTLESLVISPLSPWRLVLGKLLTAVYVGVIGKAAVLPALAVAFVLGGADLGFVPRFLILLVAVDTSLAALALQMGARRREVQSKVVWIKAQTSQTQLVMQAVVGLSVISSLIPIYAAIFLVPFALQQGVQLSETLEMLAPIGVLHPLAALVLWGETNLFGLRLPVWVLGVFFHLLLALPLLADCAEAQKTEGSEPGRLPRLLTLPLLAFTLVLTAAVCQNLGRTAQCLITTLLALIMVISAAGRSSYSKDPTAKISPSRLVAGLWPSRALRSTPEGALGFTLLVFLLVAPIAFWGGGLGAPAWKMLGALLLVGLSLAAFGVRMTARAQEKEDEAFLKALRKRSGLDPAADEEEEEEEHKSGRKEKAAKGPKRAGGLVTMISILLGGLAIVGLMLIQKGSAPILVPFKPVFVVLGTVGVALSPFAALLPVLTDPSAFGSDAVLNFLNSLGLDPVVMFLGHLGIYLGLGALALITLKKPIDLEQAMAEHKATVDALANAGAEPAPEPAPAPAPEPAPESAPEPAQ